MTIRKRLLALRPALLSDALGKAGAMDHDMRCWSANCRMAGPAVTLRVHTADILMVGKALSANQIEFINLIVDHLTEHGMVEPGRLYESPFTDVTPRGPDGLFSPTQLDELMSSLDAVRATAVAA